MTMLRYAVVTSDRRGYANHFIERAARERSQNAELAAVIFCHARSAGAPRARRRLWRKIRKAIRLGPLGTWQGFRMRRWFRDDVAARLGTGDLFETCRAASVPLLEIERFGDADAQARVRALALDLGISMGNAHIAPSFFSIPRFGMINIHHELLPEYKGAQPVVWQLHDGSRTTGFTIHEIDNRIDTGRILVREEVPIAFRATLHESAVETTATVKMRSIDALGPLLDDLDAARRTAIPNQGGRTFTTPGSLAVLRIFWNFRRLRNELTERSG